MMQCSKCRSSLSPWDGECPLGHMQEQVIASPSLEVKQQVRPAFWIALVAFLVPFVALVIGWTWFEEFWLMAPIASLALFSVALKVGRGAGEGAIVGCIFATVFMVLIPRPHGHNRETARRAACRNNLRQLGEAARNYARDHGGKLPDLSSAQSIGAALDGYLKHPAILACYSDRKPYSGNVALSGRKLKEIANPAKVILFYDADAVHFEMRNVVYVDGHVRWVKKEDWLKAKRRSGLR